MHKATAWRRDDDNVIGGKSGSSWRPVVASPGPGSKDLPVVTHGVWEGELNKSGGGGFCGCRWTPGVSGAARGRGLHSSTFQLNLSHF